MMTRLILFLIRVKLGLKKNEAFQFSNQKTTNVYYITNTNIVKKMYFGYADTREAKSTVSLNWLLSPECKIIKLKP